MTHNTLETLHYIYRHRTSAGKVTSQPFDTLDAAKEACDKVVPKDISVIFYVSNKSEDRPYLPVFIRVPSIKA